MTVNFINKNNLKVLCRELSAADGDMNIIFQAFGVPPLWARPHGFSTLIHIILEQQVSLASAQSAFDKLQTVLGKITPEGVLSLTDAEMKAAYFSRQKTVYARELSTAVLEKRLIFEELDVLSDGEIRSELVKIKGIGRWTADIYLLMACLRPDVMPKGDLALHTAWQKLENLERRPNAEEFQQIAERWKPLRSVAARLLWHFYLSSKIKTAFRDSENPPHQLQ